MAMFLAHSPREMKRHFAMRNWAALDEAADRLGGESFVLAMPNPHAASHQIITETEPDNGARSVGLRRLADVESPMLLVPWTDLTDAGQVAPTTPSHNYPRFIAFSDAALGSP